MKFQNFSNRNYQILGFLALVAGFMYLGLRIHDFIKYYEFMLGRTLLFSPDNEWDTILLYWVKRTLIFLILTVEILYILEHALFFAANWRYRLPKAFHKNPRDIPHRELPFITVLIPTYNESPEIVEATVRAAAQIDYPHNKFEILLLDDEQADTKSAMVKKVAGEFSAVSLKYHSRIREGKTRLGYKGGNLNYGISLAKPETMGFLLLDSDHQCLPGIIWDLLPYALAEHDGKMHWSEEFGFVQAPQTYQNGASDYWDRPCREFHTVTQGYRAYRKAVMLTGTGALVSASALSAVGNFDETTVTEDIITGAKIQGRKFASYYHPNPVAYGLVPDSMRYILKQRLRWAQGTFQFLKKWRACTKGMSIGQKIEYLSGISYFFMAIPYIILSLVPPIVMIGGFDTSLHYSTESLVCLWFFAILRYYSREIYCRKSLLDRTSMTYLGILYSPIYFYAFLTVMVKRSLIFWTTPKTSASNAGYKWSEAWYFMPPLFIAYMNLIAITIILYDVLTGGYTWKGFFIDYAGFVLLALHFAAGGLSVMTVGEKS